MGSELIRIPVSNTGTRAPDLARPSQTAMDRIIEAAMGRSNQGQTALRLACFNTLAGSETRAWNSDRPSL
jgi:hypothetical protein